MIRVALDAMGGDYAPAEAVRGALQAASDQIQVLLFGDLDRLTKELSAHPANSAVSVVPTSQEVTMHDHPVKAYRQKPDSSLRRAVEAVHLNQADAVVSAGNTGAAMTAALLTFGAVPGVERPAIGAPLPTALGRALLLDAGANVDCDAGNLCEFAMMGSIYAQAAWGLESPVVGLLNIGEEPSKGNAVTKQSYERLKALPLHFIGNVEARELFAGKADVVVADGFVGNVLLKAGEGVAEMIASALKDLAPAIGPDVVRNVLQQLRSKMDYAVYGGAPLLGLNGVCFIGHGRSGASAIANAIHAAARCAESGVVQRIRKYARDPQAANG
jgi:glycerol-3-phosphate acyltransferase PlsX